MTNYRAASRFLDTVQLLRECYDHLDDELEGTEQVARKHLIELCQEITVDTEEE